MIYLAIALVTAALCVKAAAFILDCLRDLDAMERDR